MGIAAILLLSFIHRRGAHGPRCACAYYAQHTSFHDTNLRPCHVAPPFAGYAEARGEAESQLSITSDFRAYGRTEPLIGLRTGAAKRAPRP